MKKLTVPISVFALAWLLLQEFLQSSWRFHKEIQLARDPLIFLLENLGFCDKYGKLELQIYQKTEFLWVIVDSKQTVLSLPQWFQ